jgi:hypothetical protein
LASMRGTVKLSRTAYLISALSTGSGRNTHRLQ